MSDTFRARLRRGDQLIGAVVTLASPDVADLLSRMGFDYLWLDVEHSAMGISQAQMLIQAAGGRCPCIVRVPENSEAWIKKALDTGCDGVMIPQIRSAAEARAAVAACLYPPAGQRGAGVSRAQGYGLSFSEYVARANADLAIIVQIEHTDAVDDIQGILATPGLTALLVGPYDLSGSMGLLGQVTHPRVIDAVERVRRAALAAGMPIGIYTDGADAARAAFDQGFALVALASDVAYLIDGARRALAGARTG
ncbi:MAG: 5-keto-4-deoxy-D-glucarate aldolase [Chloroflexi bacterium ADurb.Bin325]|nr:MAG: 5-keto-4-deoxy-D-glucarate aldolase [Chloroflexi bacterium ADurb.Bin325]